MALPHLVHPGRNGYLYQPGDIAALAGHARQLLGAPALRDQLGQASRQLARTHDAASTLDQFEELYASLGAHTPLHATATGRPAMPPRRYPPP